MAINNTASGGKFLRTAHAVTASEIDVDDLRIADDRSRLCTSSEPNCTSPPYSNDDRKLLGNLEAVKYVSAGMFWALYGYGVWDAHRHFIPIVETEVGPAGQPTGVKVGIQGSF